MGYTSSKLRKKTLKLDHRMNECLFTCARKHTHTHTQTNEQMFSINEF